MLECAGGVSDQGGLTAVSTVMQMMKSDLEGVAKSGVVGTNYIKEVAEKVAVL